MAKGRIPKTGVREPNGRLSRAIEKQIDGCSPAEIKRLRDAALRRVASPEWGTHLGLLFLEDKCSAHEYEAGKRWDRLTKLYLEAKKAPAPDPRAVPIGSGSGGHEIDPDSEEGRFEAAEHLRIVDAWNRAWHHLTLMVGPAAIASMRRIVEGKGQPPEGYEDLQRARIALRALVKFWELTNAVRPRQK